MQFTLVSTVFNEAKRLDQTIQDLQAQTLQPSEIIITDAGSNDGTYEMLLEWQGRSIVPIIILQKQRCNVAEGRNMAIRAAQYDLIASTDFGCRFHPQWLESLMQPFADPTVKVVGGAFAVVEQDIQTTAAKAAYLLSSGYKVDVHADWFIPSSRSIAYYKEVFTTIGGYCEWLTLAADDLVFGKEIKANKYKIFIVDKPFVYWGRHTQANGYIKESFRYGLGDGEARVNQRSVLSTTIEMSMRYLFFISLIILPVLIAMNTLPAYSIFLGVLLLPGFRSYVSYTRNWMRLNYKYGWSVFLYGYILLEQTRRSYIKGYCKGYFKSNDAQKQAAVALQQRLAQ
jgi:glycosyltransferase involved in cell wall biosynthesis